MDYDLLRSEVYVNKFIHFNYVTFQRHTSFKDAVVL